MYLDLWPFADSILWPLDPDIAQQVGIGSDKHQALHEVMTILAGEGNMVSMKNGPFGRSGVAS